MFCHFTKDAYLDCGFVMQILQLREESDIKMVRQKLQIIIKRKMPFFVCSEITAK